MDMAIQRPPAPQEVTAAFLKGLGNLLLDPKVAQKVAERYLGEPTRVPTQADLGGLLEPNIVHDAQHVYSLGLDAAARGDADDIVKAGWRLFAGTTQQMIVMGRVTWRGQSGWKMSAVNYGDWAWSVLEATRKLDELPQVKTADYELRVLAVPALSLEAFWLVSKTEGTQDLVVPFRSPGADDERRAAVEPLPNYLASIRQQVLPIGARR
jgi:hypothetical protein